MSEINEQELIAKSLRYAELMTDVNRELRFGRFNGVPDDLARKNYHFVRLGRKDDPRAGRKAQDLCERGYTLAPPGVRAVGFESEGDAGLIVCAPPEVYHNLNFVKQANLSRKRDRMRLNDMNQIEAQLRQSLGGKTDVNVTSVLGQGTYGDMSKDLAVASAQVTSAGNQRKR